jgi:hypothetical protein
MYASIRIYKTSDVDELARIVSEEFAPRIKKVPGFLAYYCLAPDKETWVSVSIFKTNPQTEESNRLAAEFVQNLNMIHVVRRVEMFTGEIATHCLADDAPGAEGQEQVDGPQISDSK